MYDKPDMNAEMALPTFTIAPAAPCDDTLRNALSITPFDVQLKYAAKQLAASATSAVAEPVLATTAVDVAAGGGGGVDGSASVPNGFTLPENSK